MLLVQIRGVRAVSGARSGDGEEVPGAATVILSHFTRPMLLSLGLTVMDT